MQNVTSYPISSYGDGLPRKPLSDSCFHPIRGTGDPLEESYNSTVELYSCQMCGRQYKRRTDANRHLRQVHNGGISVNRVRNRNYIPAQGEIPRKPPAVTSTPTSTDITSPVDRQQARMEAQADRQRIKEEAERGQAVAMTNRDLDHVFPEDRFTLMSTEPDVLDYE